MAVSVTAYVSSGQSDDNTATVTSWANGDLLVAIAGLENGAGNNLSLSSSTLSWTQEELLDNNNGQECEGGVWTHQATSGGSSETVTANSSGNLNTMLIVWVIPAAEWDSFTVQTGNRNESAFSITTGSGDGVLLGVWDWNANNPPGKTPATGSGTATERIDDGDGASMAGYAVDWVNTSAGTFDFGPNNYTSLQVTQHAVLVTAAAAAAGSLVVPPRRIHRARLAGPRR